MLTLTENARSTVRDLTTQAGLPEETGGLRIAEQEAGGFELALVARPAPGDDLVTDGTARVYVDQAASAALTDQELDVDTAAPGASFTLAPQWSEPRQTFPDF
ncbi:adhesin [Cellulomonas sp. URHB0016]